MENTAEKCYPANEARNPGPLPMFLLFFSVRQMFGSNAFFFVGGGGNMEDSTTAVATAAWTDLPLTQALHACFMPTGHALPWWLLASELRSYGAWLEFHKCTTSLGSPLFLHFLKSTAVQPGGRSYRTHAPNPYM